MGLLHVASSPLNSSVVFAITRLFSRWFQSMAVHMNKEFLVRMFDYYGACVVSDL